MPKQEHHWFFQVYFYILCKIEHVLSAKILINIYLLALIKFIVIYLRIYAFNMLMWQHGFITFSFIFGTVRTRYNSEIWRRLLDLRYDVKTSNKRDPPPLWSVIIPFSLDKLLVNCCSNVVFLVHNFLFLSVES